MSSLNLTPIKIPGKKMRDQRRTVFAANRNVHLPKITPFGCGSLLHLMQLADTYLQKRSRPPGHPSKLLTLREPRLLSRSPAISTKLSRQRSLKHLKSKPKMALLEKLPVEILTPIFLQSMSLDLPRASPVIAGKLSSQLTIVTAIVNAFSPTWEYYYSLIRSDRTSRGHVAGDANLQSAILRCRCATLSNMRHAQDTWLRNSVDEEWPKYLATSHRLFEHHSRRNHNQVAKSDLSFIKEYKSRWCGKATDDWFSQDYADFQQISNATEKTSISFFDTQWKWTGLLLMHTNLEIPESLLQGPWTDEMVEYLFWLIRADARIHWKSSTSGEVALMGLKTAIRTGNLQIMFIFQSLGLGNTVTLEVMRWAIENAGGDKIEVILRVMSMFLYGGDENNHDSDLLKLQLGAELNKLRLKAQQQQDASMEKVEVVALVEAFDNLHTTLTNLVHSKVTAKILTNFSDGIV